MRRLIDTDLLRVAGFADAADFIEEQARIDAEARSKMMAPPRPVRHRPEVTTYVREDGRQVITSEGLM